MKKMGSQQGGGGRAVRTATERKKYYKDQDRKQRKLDNCRTFLEEIIERQKKEE